jgi:hypothetical protein
VSETGQSWFSRLGGRLRRFTGHLRLLVALSSGSIAARGHKLSTAASSPYRRGNEGVVIAGIGQSSMSTLRGAAGIAREIVGERSSRDQEATLKAWLLHCPGQSAAWSDYMLGVIHLRPVVGQSRAPRKDAPGATHEFILVALDPRHNPRPDDLASLKPLTPINLRVQIGKVDDELAVRIARAMAEAAVAGEIAVEPALSGVERFERAWVRFINAKSRLLRRRG